MKTSNKLLLTAFIILFGSLAAYNMALKTEYDTGAYKDPYRDFVTLSFRNFDQIQINPATEMNVKIVSGNYKVQVHKEATKLIQMKQKGKLLQVDLNFPKEQQQEFRLNELVVITCPNISSLNTNAFYTDNGKKITSSVSHYDNTVLLQGFKLDSLAVQLDRASAVTLKDTKMKRLRAIVGLSTGSTSRLYLDRTDTIEEANLDIRNKSELVLDNITIPKLTYQFADSAKATFSGSALGILIPKFH